MNLRTRIGTLAAIAALMVSSAASAALLRFSDVDDFNAATTDRVIEPYFAPPGDFVSLSNATYNGIGYPEYAFMIDPGYSDLYQWGTGPVLLLDRVTTLTFAPTRAFAADFGTLNRGAFVTVTIDGILTLVPTSPSSLSFFGWVSDTAFTSVAFSTSAEFIVLDNVTRAAVDQVPPPFVVPEPGSVALMGLGVLLLASTRRHAVS